MREIEFRGKRKDNGEWVYGFYLESKVNRWIYCYDREESSDSVFLCHTVIPETVGQYTGLTDKNGVKIFEGDIMVLYAGLIRPKTIVIAWSDYCCGWCAKYKDDEYEIPTKNEILERMEIIGNIHNNPELLSWE